jgi:uncharacterized protein (DUF1778 family)
MSRMTADEERWEVKPENIIRLSAEEFDAFVAALDAPERDLPRLRKLMQQTPIWEERE